MEKKLKSVSDEEMSNVTGGKGGLMKTATGKTAAGKTAAGKTAAGKTAAVKKVPAKIKKLHF